MTGDQILIVKRNNRWFVVRIFDESVKSWILRIDQGLLNDSALLSKSEALKIAEKMESEQPSEFGIIFYNHKHRKNHQITF